MKLFRSLSFSLCLATLFPGSPVSGDPYYSYGDSCCCNSGGFRVYGDYLYWKITQDCMDYAALLPGGIQSIVEAASMQQEDLVVNADLSLIDQSFKYSSGFRLGAGYTVPCSDWDFDVSWTHFNEKTSSSVFDSGAGVIPTAFPATSIIGFIGLISGESMNFGFATGATSHWKFNFDTVDLEIAKKLYFCNCVAFRPFLGVKFASIRQKQNINYDGFVLNVDSVSVPVDISNHKKNDFRGVGPSFGFDGSWQFFQDWSLKSGISAAFVYGKFDLHQAPMVNFATNEININFSNKRNNRFIPTVNGNISIDWDTCLFDSVKLNLAVGYEIEYWWNAWRDASSIEANIIGSGAANNGDLMMQGLTVHASVGF